MSTTLLQITMHRGTSMQKRQLVIVLKKCSLVSERETELILQLCYCTPTTIRVGSVPKRYVPDWTLEYSCTWYIPSIVQSGQIELQFKPYLTSHLCTCFECTMPSIGHPKSPLHQMKRPQKKRVHGDSQLAYKIDNTMTYNITMNHASMH